MSNLFEDSTGLPGARLTKRDSLLLFGAIRAIDHPTSARQPIRIRNLSPTGLMGTCDTHYPKKCLVEIEMRGIGVVAGEVIWAREGRMGITFKEAVDPKLARLPADTVAKDRLWKVVTLGGARRPGLRID